MSDDQQHPSFDQDSTDSSVAEVLNNIQQKQQETIAPLPEGCIKFCRRVDENHPGQTDRDRRAAGIPKAPARKVEWPGVTPSMGGFGCCFVDSIDPL